MTLARLKETTELLLTGAGPDCSEPAFFPPLSHSKSQGLHHWQLRAWVWLPRGFGERQGGAWCSAVPAGCAWVGKRQRGCIPARFEGTESAMCHGHFSCCALSTESFIERQNIQFNYNCCTAIQVDLVSPTWADHNFKLGIAWKLEECISSNCQATSLFLCIHKHWAVIIVVMLELLSEIHLCYRDWLIWFILTAVSIYCISSLWLLVPCNSGYTQKTKTVKKYRAHESCSRKPMCHRRIRDLSAQETWLGCRRSIYRMPRIPST